MSEKVRSRLSVEGIDDKNAIIHLLIRNQIDYHPMNFDESPTNLPSILAAGSVEKLIDSIETEIEINSGRTVGFVVDADNSPIDRWKAIADRLKRVGVVDLPETIPPRGYIGESPAFKTRVGVWIMPDNVVDGKLENFLRGLIQESDPLIEHAESSSIHAKTLGARYSEADQIKAIIYAWLAWQEQPGKPFGLAMKARYFQHDSPVAKAFVGWFSGLYRIA